VQLVGARATADGDIRKVAIFQKPHSIKNIKLPR
jgi:hypothetical protein